MDFTPSQRLAIEHNGSDLLVSAGAGSGKTATLTERIITKILSGADISRMLVVTFTKEAANELKSRITAKLGKAMQDAINGQNPTVNVRVGNMVIQKPLTEHLSEQIVKTGGADISTIHSFCLKIIKQNFDRLSLEGNFRIGEENEIKIIKSEVMSEVVDYFYDLEKSNEEFLLVSDCYSLFSKEDALEEKLIELYDKLSSTKDFLNTLLLPCAYNGDFIDTPYGKILLDLIWRNVNHFEPFFKYAIDLVSTDSFAKAKFFEVFSRDFELINDIKRVLKSPSYSELKRVFNSYSPIKITKRKSGEIDDWYIKETRTLFKESIQNIDKKFFKFSSEAIFNTAIQNERLCHAIYNVLSKFDTEFKDRKNQNGLCDFNDIERYALALLYDDNGNISEVAKEFSNSYDEIYIDEYQDTNSVQDKIFIAISKSNRFMVGDIKQSIYRFRSAEPEIFSHYRTTFEDISTKNPTTGMGKTLFMSENFRCDKNVIKVTNLVSNYMFQNSNGIPYDSNDDLIPSKNIPAEQRDQACELCLIDKGAAESLGNGYEDDVQAEYVAKRIRDMIDNEFLPNGKKITRNDIAIILRKGKNRDRYINALKKYDVVSEYIDDVRFFEKPHILLMISILNAIDNPFKDVYLAGAMHSEIFGFSLDDLIKIRSFSDENIPLYSAVLNYDKDVELCQKINAFLDTLSTLKDETRKLNAYEAVSYVMGKTGFISMCKPYQRQDLIKLYNHARQYERNTYKGLYSFLRYIDDISSSSVKESVSENPTDSVKIMSVHASKGLEFEICFLSDTESQFNTQDSRSALLFERSLGVSGYVGVSGGIAKYNTLFRRCASAAISNATSEEEMRVLYVAMTRARSKLIITACMDKIGEKLLYAKENKDFVSPYTLYSHNSIVDYIIGATSGVSNEFVDINEIDPLTLEEKAIEAKVEEAVIDNELVEKYAEILKKRFEFDYKYKYLGQMPSKLSVSKLYPQILDGNENDEVKLDTSLDILPKFLLEADKAVTGAERGTATHVFLQFCSFENLKNNGFENELQRLIEESYIHKSTQDLIVGAHIKKFISSSLFNDFLHAKKITREFRFNIMLDAEEFSSNEDIKKEKILVQGVVDCIYENEQGELVLVDYKTDKVTEENYVSLLKERHSTQLSYYKKACELMFEREIKKVIIYSVPLGKNVEI